jgi:hypothetical protein
VEPTIADVTSSDKEKTKEHDVPEKVQSSSNNVAETTTPPFPQRLSLTKTPEQPTFNLLGELQNLYVKNPLLQALCDVPIYARTMRDICVKKPGRKTKDPLTVHVMGEVAVSCSVHRIQQEAKDRSATRSVQGQMLINKYFCHPSFPCVT